MVDLLSDSFRKPEMIVCGVDSRKSTLLAKKQFKLVIKLLVEEKLLKRLSGIFSLILQNEKYQFFQMLLP